jgi:hypothetical protein
MKSNFSQNMSMVFLILGAVLIGIGTGNTLIGVGVLCSTVGLGLGITEVISSKKK